MGGGSIIDARLLDYPTIVRFPLSAFVTGDVVPLASGFPVGLHNESQRRCPALNLGLFEFDFHYLRSIEYYYHFGGHDRSSSFLIRPEEVGLGFQTLSGCVQMPLSGSPVVDP